MYSAHHFSLYEVSYDIILCLFLDLFIKRHEESHKNSELWKTSKVSIVFELVYKTIFGHIKVMKEYSDNQQNFYGEKILS